MSEQTIQLSGLSAVEQMFRGDFMGHQGNDDPILRAKGSGLCELYAPLLQDSQVCSVLQQRVSQTLSREILVTPCDDSALAQQVAVEVRELLDCEKMRMAQKQLLLNGLLFGFAPAEILWRNGAKGFEIEGLAVRKPGRFVFLKNGDLALRRIGQQTHEVLPQEKFVVFRHGAMDADSPYGRGLGYQLFWPVQFKRLMIKWEARNGENFGIPSLVAKYPNNSTPEQIEAAGEVVRAIENNSRIAVPVGMEVEFIQAVGNGAIFERALRR